MPDIETEKRGLLLAIAAALCFAVALLLWCWIRLGKIISDSSDDESSPCSVGDEESNINSSGGVVRDDSTAPLLANEHIPGSEVSKRSKLPVTTDPDQCPFGRAAAKGSVERKDAAPSAEQRMETKTEAGDIGREFEPLPFLVTDMPSEEEALQVFDELDDNKNKTLSFHQLGKAVKRFFPSPSHRANVARAHHAADENADGMLRRDEFECFLRYAVFYNNAWESFSDEAGKHVGKVNRKGFARMASSFGLKGDLDQLFTAIDNNASMEITYDEFCTWMARNSFVWSLSSKAKGSTGAKKPTASDKVPTEPDTSAGVTTSTSVVREAVVHRTVEGERKTESLGKVTAEDVLATWDSVMSSSKTASPKVNANGPSTPKRSTTGDAPAGVTALVGRHEARGNQSIEGERKIENLGRATAVKTVGGSVMSSPKTGPEVNAKGPSIPKISTKREAPAEVTASPAEGERKNSEAGSVGEGEIESHGATADNIVGDILDTWVSVMPSSTKSSPTSHAGGPSTRSMTAVEDGPTKASNPVTASVENAGATEINPVSHVGDSRVVAGDAKPAIGGKATNGDVDHKPSSVVATVSVENEGNQGPATAKDQANFAKRPFALVSLPSEDQALAVFDELDTDHNHTLAYRLLGTVLKRLFPSARHHASIKNACETADGTKYSFLRREEFEFFVRYVAYYDDAWDFFGDANGHVREMSSKEFAKSAANFGIDDSDVEAMFSSMDLDDSDTVSFDEFCKWMARHTCEWDVAPSHALTNREQISIPAALTMSLPTREEAYSVFDEADVDNNKVLSVDECEKVCKQLFSGLRHKAPIRKAYDVAIKHGSDGLLRRDDFECFLRYIVYYNDAYEFFCNDRKAHMSKMKPLEFAKVSVELGVVASSDEAFKLMDDNSSGSLTFEEYCEWMAHNSCEWDLGSSDAVAGLPARTVKTEVPSASKKKKKKKKKSKS